MNMVIGILGPTGVGKTAVGIAVAQRLGTRVISCDSMQIYKDFPVLTNQPSPEEQATVRHELLGILEPTAEFSAGEYARLARPLIEEDVAQHGAAVIVGGTGLYMRAAVAPLATRPAADKELRSRLEAWAAAAGPQALHQELAHRDPAAAAALDPRNIRRLVRALEVVIRTGQPWSGRTDLWRPAYFHKTLLIGLNLNREELYQRINVRAQLMIERGAVEEVRRFLAAQWSSPARDGLANPVIPVGTAMSAAAAGSRSGIRAAIGFAEITHYLEGAQTLQETSDQVSAATRRYARRQLTWLRKLEDLVIIEAQGREPSAVAEQILALVASVKNCKEPSYP